MNQPANMQGALQGLFDPEEKFRHEASTGTKLLVAAWLVEILAAILGLFFAWSQAYMAYINEPNPGINTFLQAIQGALPFILIALIELTKIPLALGLYKVRSWSWKIFILVGLIGLTIITFESIVVGLETNLNNTTGTVSRTNNKLQKVNTETVALKKQESEIKNTTIAKRTKDLNQSLQQALDTRDAELMSIQKLWDKDIDIITAEIDQLIQNKDRLEIASGNAIKANKSGIEKEIERLQSELKRVYAERDKELDNYRKKIDKQNLGSTESVEKEVSKLKEFISNLKNKIKGFNEEKSVIQTALSSRISELKSEERNKLRDLKEARVAEIKECDNSGMGWANCMRVDEITEKFETKKKELSKNYAQSKSTENSKSTAKLEVIDNKINEIRDEIKKVEQKSLGLSPVRSSYDPIKIKQIKRKFVSQIKSLNIELRKEKDALRNINKENAGTSRIELASLRGKIKALNEQKTRSNQKFKTLKENKRKSFEPKLKDINQRLIKRSKEVKAEKNRLPAIKQRLTEIDQEIVRLKETKRKASENNSVYRITAFVYGLDDVADVKKEQLKLVAGIWFGSIALIAATIGTILALISFILRDPEAFEEKQRFRRTRATLRLFRLMLLRIISFLRSIVVLIGSLVALIFTLPLVFRGIFGRRVRLGLRVLATGVWRKYRKPKIVEKEVTKEVEVIKEITKEVPVDRVVKQEVPFEVIKERVVHVPIASDDLTVLEIKSENNDEPK